MLVSTKLPAMRLILANGRLKSQALGKICNEWKTSSRAVQFRFTRAYIAVALLDFDKITQMHPITTCCSRAVLTSLQFVYLACVDMKVNFLQLNFFPCRILQNAFTRVKELRGYEVYLQV